MMQEYANYELKVVYGMTRNAPTQTHPTMLCIHLVIVLTMASMVTIIVGYSSSIPLPKKTQPHKFAGKCMINYTQAAKIFSEK